MKGPRVQPFSCGTQGADWKDRNCDGCIKGYDVETARWNCDIERAIDRAWIGDGTVSATMARRMGITGENCTHYTWKCPEFASIPDQVAASRPADLPGQGLLFGNE